MFLLQNDELLIVIIYEEIDETYVLLQKIDVFETGELILLDVLDVFYMDKLLHDDEDDDDIVHDVIDEIQDENDADDIEVVETIHDDEDDDFDVFVHEIDETRLNIEMLDNDEIQYIEIDEDEDILPVVITHHDVDDVRIIETDEMRDMQIEVIKEQTFVDEVQFFETDENLIKQEVSDEILYMDIDDVLLENVEIE